MKKISKLHVFVLILLLLLINSCSDDSNDPVGPDNIADERGEIVESEVIATLSAVTINNFLTIGFPDFNSDFQAQNDIELIKIVYKTLDAQGNLVDASGIIGKPEVNNAAPLISLHHGTQTKRDRVGSESLQDAYQSIIAASVGYVTSEPDYLGFGVSDMFHPYLHEETSASTAIDMLRATKQYCEENDITLNDQLFLAGYSQGGYVTMAAHKEIEANLSDEFTVTASAPMAGPHDLLGTALFITLDDEYPRPSFISFIALAYNDVYQWNRVDEIFKTPYNTIAPALFNGSLTTGEIDDQLPTNLRQLFNDSFIDGIRSLSLSYIVDAFTGNSLLDWTPIAPITIIHGDADTFVPYNNATTTRNALINNGASFVDLVTIEGGDHGSSVLPAIEYTFNWFNSFREGGMPKIRLVR